MNRLVVRCLVGLVVAVALAWGASPDVRAAAADAAKATAKATAKAATAAATATAKAAAKATAAVTPATPQGKGKGGTTPGQQTQITDAAGRVHTVPTKVTQAQRQAAADRLKAARLAALAARQATAAAQPGVQAAAAAPVALAGPLALAAPAGGYLVGPNDQLIPDYSGMVPNWAFSPILTKFKDPLPGLYINNVGMQLPASSKYIPVAQARPWPVGCGVAPAPACQNVDYYEIELAEYSTWSFHSELANNTKLRGYAQTNATDPLINNVHSYLGPVILAQKGRPVRVTFTNRLPIGAGGNLYIPVDPTMLGAGPGPSVDDATRLATPADVLCKPNAVGQIPSYCFSQNRATLHLHGGVTPWISDGTTHQWITPAGETSAFKNGMSVFNVPDMPNPGKPGSATNPVGSGSQTFYWTNDQAARLMFYHDHAMGITRLNVYVGEAAGYLLRDDAEIGLENAGLIPRLLENIPLVIQEKGFVDAATIGATDPTWNWGTGTTSPYTDSKGKTIQLRTPVTGDLWWPHVYMPAQNPSDLSGYNAMGRWNYGPWFFPPTPIPYGPVLNPYTGPGQPYEIPGTPNPSWGAEAFLDTPVINGTAYPTLTVKPQPYRFRILNAGGDRFVNLQLYQAFSNLEDTTADRVFPTLGLPTVPCNAITSPATCTEVKMVPASPNNVPLLQANWPQDGRAGGVPDPLTAGPSFYVIGTEGGFLPMPVEVKPQPVVWNNDPLTFNFGNVSDFSLLLGPAERADAIVDFSAYPPGTTFILYNDAPAAFPALDPRNDYYTGNPDQTATGGTIQTLPGKGPNTRTIMRIVVDGTGNGTTFNLASLQAAFTTDLAAIPPKIGVFKASQDEIVVGQSAYDATYGKTFPSTYPWWGLGTIFDSNVRFETVAGQQVTLLAQNKAIHDEMGATFDDYGRMKASLGVQMPNPTPVQANFIMQGYSDPATEVVQIVSTPIGNPAADGTQIWRVNHNGVDTHPIHFHLFHVQLINRVGWDGAYRLPHPTELGWKDTVRISPLEDTYVALRPIAPTPASLPFKIPNSFRPLDPTLPIGSTIGFSNIDPLGNPIVPGLTNQVANFGWEYVWHCHILSHEENDMMRAVVFAVPPETPLNLTAAPAGGGNNRRAILNWTNASLTATGFTVQRADDPAFTLGLTSWALGVVTTFTDTTIQANRVYYYRVQASNTVGSGVPNYPTITADSLWSNVAQLGTLSPPAAPTNLAATIQAGPQVRLSWTDNATNESSYEVRRCLGATCTILATSPALAAVVANTTAYVDTAVVAGNTYRYQVYAVNAAGTVAAANGPITVALTAPVAPVLNVPTVARQGANDRVTLTWNNLANESSYTLQRCAGTCSATAAGWANVTTAIPANTTTYVDTVSRGIPGFTRYSYRVRGVNVIGPGAFSNIRTIVTQ
jgi:FtsP/CotA-like multicopper oxidase with cupredoxin domain